MSILHAELAVLCQSCAELCRDRLQSCVRWLLLIAAGPCHEREELIRTVVDRHAELL
jgi:hypothetical protein